MTATPPRLCDAIGVPLGLVLEGGYDLGALAGSMAALMPVLVDSSTPDPGVVERHPLAVEAVGSPAAVLAAARYRESGVAVGLTVGLGVGDGARPRPSRTPAPRGARRRPRPGRRGPRAPGRPRAGCRTARRRPRSARARASCSRRTRGCRRGRPAGRARSRVSRALRVAEDSSTTVHASLPAGQSAISGVPVPSSVAGGIVVDSGVTVGTAAPASAWRPAAWRPAPASSASSTSARISATAAIVSSTPTSTAGPRQLGGAAIVELTSAPQFRHHSCSVVSSPPQRGQRRVSSAREAAGLDGGHGACSPRREVSGSRSGERTSSSRRPLGPGSKRRWPSCAGPPALVGRPAAASFGRGRPSRSVCHRLLIGSSSRSARASSSPTALPSGRVAAALGAGRLVLAAGSSAGPARLARPAASAPGSSGSAGVVRLRGAIGRRRLVAAGATTGSSPPTPAPSPPLHAPPQAAGRRPRGRSRAGARASAARRRRSRPRAARAPSHRAACHSGSRSGRRWRSSSPHSGQVPPIPGSRSTVSACAPEPRLDRTDLGVERRDPVRLRLGQLPVALLRRPACGCGGPRR